MEQSEKHDIGPRRQIPSEGVFQKVSKSINFPEENPPPPDTMGIQLLACTTYIGGFIMVEAKRAAKRQVGEGKNNVVPAWWDEQPTV